MTLLDEMLKMAQIEAQEDNVYIAAAREMCRNCLEGVIVKDNLCQACLDAKERGYWILPTTGRCADGAQRDAGKLYHAVTDFKAACGYKPGSRSRWSEYQGKTVTCPRCLKKIKK